MVTRNSRRHWLKRGAIFVPAAFSILTARAQFLPGRSRSFIPAAGGGGGVTAPTFVSVTSSPYDDTSDNETTASVSWSTGNLIVVVGVTEDYYRELQAPTATGLTFSLVTSIGTVDNCIVYVWSASAGSGGSSAVSCATVGGFAWRCGISVFVVSGSAGIGATATLDGSSAKTVSLTRSYANSGVIAAFGDWNAVDDTAVTATPTGTVDVAKNFSGAYTAFVTHYGSQGSTGTTSYGITDHTGTVKLSGACVEVRGQ